MNAKLTERLTKSLLTGEWLIVIDNGIKFHELTIKQYLRRNSAYSALIGIACDNKQILSEIKEKCYDEYVQAIKELVKEEE